MKRDKNYIWAKFCSYLSNGKLQTQLSDLTIDKSDEKLFNMIKKDQQIIDNAAYMYDKETNEAWNELHGKIIGEKGKRKLFPFNQALNLKIAASIVLIIGISWIGLTLYEQSGLIEKQTHSSQSVEILPDGTTVYLNANSKIEYPENFSAKKREVVLSGEAFFDVIEDTKRPFIIKAEDARIEVLGTSFNIFTDHSTKKVEVLVESGSVSLSGIKNSDKLILTKGQLGSLQDKRLKREKISDSNYLSWKTQIITFEKAPLTYVIDILNKTYNTNIRVDQKVFSDFKLNAKFEKAPLDTVLESICLAFDLEKASKEGEIELVAKTN